MQQEKYSAEAAIKLKRALNSWCAQIKSNPKRINVINENANWISSQMAIGKIRATHTHQCGTHRKWRVRVQCACPMKKSSDFSYAFTAV